MTFTLIRPTDTTNVQTVTTNAPPPAREYKQGDRVIVTLEGTVPGPKDRGDFQFVGHRDSVPFYLIHRKIVGVTLLQPAPPDWQVGDVISYRWTARYSLPRTIVRTADDRWPTSHAGDYLTDTEVNSIWHKGLVEHLVRDGAAVED